MLRSSCFVNSSTSSFFTIATIIITVTLIDIIVTLIDIVVIITAVHSAAFGFVFCNGPILGLWHLIFACSADTDDQWSPNCQTVTLITKLSNDLVAISRDFDCRSLHRIEWQSHPVSKLFWLHVEKTRTKLFLHQLSEVTLLLALVGNLSHHMWLLLQPRKEDIWGVVHRQSPRDTKLLKIVLILQQTPKKIPNIRIVLKHRKLWQLLIVRTPSQFVTSGNLSWIQMTVFPFVYFQECECGLWWNNDHDVTMKRSSPISPPTPQLQAPTDTFQMPPYPIMPCVKHIHHRCTQNHHH